MTRDDLTEKLLDIKREKGWTWKYICGEIGGMSPIMVTGAISTDNSTFKLNAPCKVVQQSNHPYRR